MVLSECIYTSIKVHVYKNFKITNKQKITIFAAAWSKQNLKRLLMTHENMVSVYPPSLFKQYILGLVTLTADYRQFLDFVFFMEKKICIEYNNERILK